MGPENGIVFLGLAKVSFRECNASVFLSRSSKTRETTVSWFVEYSAIDRAKWN